MLAKLVLCYLATISTEPGTFPSPTHLGHTHYCHTHHFSSTTQSDQPLAEIQNTAWIPTTRVQCVCACVCVCACIIRKRIFSDSYQASIFGVWILLELLKTCLCVA